MKTLSLLGRIFAALLITLGFNSCGGSDSIEELTEADCIICEGSYDGEDYSYTYCRDDYDYTDAEWADLIEEVSEDWENEYNGSCKVK